MSAGTGIYHKDSAAGTIINTSAVWNAEHVVAGNVPFNPYLTRVDLERIWIKHGLTYGTNVWHPNCSAGMCYDPTTYCFYVMFADMNGSNRHSLLLKLDEEGHVLASRYCDTRAYHVPVIANGGLLYAAEWRYPAAAGVMDQLSTTDLSLVENTVTFGAGYRRAYSIIKQSDTVVVLFGGEEASPGSTDFYVIDLVAKSYDKYDVGNGMIQGTVKVGDYVYFDRYGEWTGNTKLHLTDYSTSAMGAPPSTTNDLVPLFSDGTYIWHGELGAADTRPCDQEIYKYNLSTEAWTELNADQYFGNDDYPGNWGALYFAEINQALWFRGCTRYYAGPSNQLLFDVATEEFQNITHLFDNLFNSPTVLDTAAMANPNCVVRRLSHDSHSVSGVTVGDLGVHCGPRPVGFLKDGHYKFLIGMNMRYNDGAEKGYPILVYGDLRAW